MEEAVTDTTAMPASEYITRHYTSALKEVLSSASSALGMISETRAASQSPSAIVVSSPKAAEAQRQAGRIRPYIHFLSKDTSESAKKKSKNISRAIRLIYSFSTSPLPVPIASIGEENSSLFIKDGDFYGDIEIDGDIVEYYLKWKEPDGTEQEEYGEESIELDRIPPKLLFRLYSQLVRY